VTRYRLRFLLQEFDLFPGDTLLGRSSACHISIEDPLVSRRHARLRVTGDVVTIEDLGSRNGLHVNGELVKGSQRLADGDRIRIGTHEVVFCCVELKPQRLRSATPATGFKWRCTECGQLYPTELDICPECGEVTPRDERTLTGSGGGSDRDWPTELLAEVLDRALGLELWQDMERILQRTQSSVDERLAVKEPVDGPGLARVARAALSLAAVRTDVRWASWVLSVYARLFQVPPPEVVEHLARLPAAEMAACAPALSRLVEAVYATGGPRPDDQEAVERMDILRRMATEASKSE
jgi:hypothetical protein